MVAAAYSVSSRSMPFMIKYTRKDTTAIAPSAAIAATIRPGSVTCTACACGPGAAGAVRGGARTRARTNGVEVAVADGGHGDESEPQRVVELLDGASRFDPLEDEEAVRAARGVPRVLSWY
jgi:hypothetical protein